MNSEQIVKILDFWKKVALEDNLFSREVVGKIDLKSKEIIDLVGPRRSGKSSVLKLLIKKLDKNKSFLYVNFEDPFFIENNTAPCIEILIDTYSEYFDKNLYYLFFDEIQNVKNWETAVRKLRDSGKYKIFVTGSSSKLLSKELSSLISGRHLTYNVFPLSFAEYLDFKRVNVKTKKDLIIKKNSLLKMFQKYLETGGFPQVVLFENIELIKQYFNDIVQRDIVSRYEIRDMEALKRIGIYLTSNISKTLSLRKVAADYGVSPEIAGKYFNYFKEAFLIFELQKFSFSLKKQERSQPKIYCVDTGLINAVSFKFSEERGRVLENVVFVHLKRQNASVYYWNNQNAEVDFVVQSNNKKLEAIQVCWSVSDKETLDRELKGISEAAKELRITKAKILTYEESGNVQINGVDVEIEPVYRWMLNGEES
jgi:uncharacterized protein